MANDQSTELPALVSADDAGEFAPAGRKAPSNASAASGQQGAGPAGQAGEFRIGKPLRYAAQKGELPRVLGAAPTPFGVYARFFVSRAGKIVDAMHHGMEAAP